MEQTKGTDEDESSESASEAPPAAQTARIISIGGGKGGVGKSLLATNLAVTIAQSGQKVVLCDMDLGAANLHIMLGIAHPNPGIPILLSADGNLQNALTETKVKGLQLLAGTGGTVASANVAHALKLRMLRKLKMLEADVVIVDVGAGVGYNALDFFELGQQRIIVATPQVTSVHDAYAFLKGAVLRTLRHHAARNSEAWMLDPALASKEGDKVKNLLARIHEQDPVFGEKVEHILKHFGAYLVGNQVQDPSQVGVFHAVARMVEDFLGIDLPILGWIPANTRLADSINERSPFMARLTQGESREARSFRLIVEGLTAGDMAPEEELLFELVEDSDAAVPLPTTDPSSPELPAGVSAGAPHAPAIPPAPPIAAVKAKGPPAREVSDLPAPVKPRVYVPPQRKRKAEPEEKKRKRALDAQGRRRSITLPGMPPSRSKP